MSYLQFHLVFIVPPLLLLLPLAVRRGRVLGPRARWALPAVAAIAFLWTTPWDNYLVRRGVWWYGADRVLGTMGWVPVEEYAFFILQPLLTGAWTYVLLASQEVKSVDDRRAPRVAGTVAWTAAALAGAFGLRVDAGVYAGLIVVWAAPVLAAQWWFVAPAVLGMSRTFVLAAGVPTFYLWIADRHAIAQGIWSISPRYTTGLHLSGLPVEEALFFLVTNLLVVQGLLLFLAPERHRAEPAAARVRGAEWTV